jgi:hypothetical protein
MVGGDIDAGHGEIRVVAVRTVGTKLDADLTKRR